MKPKKKDSAEAIVRYLAKLPQKKAVGSDNFDRRGLVLDRTGTPFFYLSNEDTAKLVFRARALVRAERKRKRKGGKP